MARQRLMGPGVDHDLVQREFNCQFPQPRRHLFRRAGNRLFAQRCDGGAFRGAVAGIRRICIFRRDQRRAQALLEADAPMLARLQQATCFLVGVCRQRPDAMVACGTG
jgi:hypothetical protein